MTNLDTKRLMAEIALRHGIRMDGNDPALAIVSLNQLVLEELTAELAGRIGLNLRDFESSVQKIQTRAGKLVAQEFNERAAALRHELEGDLQVAGSKAADLVYKIQKAHSRSSLMRWTTLGLASGAGMFASGLWIGARYLHF